MIFTLIVQSTNKKNKKFYAMMNVPPVVAPIRACGAKVVFSGGLGDLRRGAREGAPCAGSRFGSELMTWKAAGS